MGRLSSTRDGNSSEKTRGPAAKGCVEEEKENGFAGKPVRTATEDADEGILWDEV
jgi:hypothetical protein